MPSPKKDKKNKRNGSVERILFKKTTEQDTQHWVYENAQRPLVPSQVQDGSRFHVHFDEDAGSDADSNKSSKSTTSSDSSDNPIALDGGYGWWIVGISFFMHTICDGFSFSFGLIATQILKRFDGASHLAIYAITGTFLSIPLIVAPLAGMFTDKYDCRKATMLGSGISLIGLFISLFTYNIWIFYFSFSVTTSFGMSFLYNAGICLVTYYFDEKRALATGAATTGTGVGTMVISFALMQIIRMGFGLTAITIFMIICFSIIFVLGLVMRDVKWESDTTESKNRKFERRTRSMKMDLPAIKIIADQPFRRANSAPTLSTRDQRTSTLENSSSVSNLFPTDPAVNRSVSVATFRRIKVVGSKRHLRRFTMLEMMPPTELENETEEHLEHLDLEVTRKRQSSKSSYDGVIDALDLALPKDSSEDEETKDEQPAKDKLFTNIGGSSSSGSTEMSTDGCSSASTESEIEDEESGNDNDALKKHLLKAVPSIDLDRMRKKEAEKVDAALELGADHHAVNEKRTPAARGPLRPQNAFARSRIAQSNAFRSRLERGQMADFKMQGRSGSAPTVYVVKKKRRMKVFTDIRKQFVQTWRDWVRITDVWMVIFLVSVCITYFLYDIPYVNVPEYLTETLKWDEEDANFLVTLQGLASIPAMILFGWFADRPLIKRHLFLLYGVGIMVAGASILLIALCTSVWAIYGISLIYGFFIAVNYMLSSVVVCEIVSVSDFQAGISLMNCTTGLANLIGPPFVGFLRDYFGSHSMALYLGGLGIMLSGSITIGMYYRVVQLNFKWREDDDEDEEEDEDAKALLTEKDGIALNGIRSPRSPRNGTSSPLKSILVH